MPGQLQTHSSDVTKVLRKLIPGKLPLGELRRFRAVYALAAISPSDEAAYLAPLHTTLSLPRNTKEFPWATLSTIRVIDLIYHKYTPSTYRSKGDSARAIEDVVVGSKAITSLDLPTLIYATRNWTIHGSLLDSSFRGAPKQYQLYVPTITRSLAHVIGRFAGSLTTAV